jgi:hypothetical protein
MKKTIKMISKQFIIVVIGSSQILYSCGQNKQPQELTKKHIKDEVATDSKCEINIEYLKTKFLGKPLSANKDLNGCFVIKDTLMDGDDGVTWSAKSYKRNKEMSFLLESSWIDTGHITRITIFDSQIKSPEGIGIGNSLKDIYNKINKKTTPMPDGYLAFGDLKDQHITYIMDINGYPALQEGRIWDIDKMPKDVKINSIVIN